MQKPLSGCTKTGDQPLRFEGRIQRCSRIHALSLGYQADIPQGTPIAARRTNPEVFWYEQPMS